MPRPALAGPWLGDLLYPSAAVTLALNPAILTKAAADYGDLLLREHPLMCNRSSVKLVVYAR